MAAIPTVVMFSSPFGGMMWQQSFNLGGQGMFLLDRTVLAIVFLCAIQASSGRDFVSAEMPDFGSQDSTALTASISDTQLETNVLPTVEAELTWFDNFEAGWDAAKQTGRPMVIFITSEECTYCDAMKKNTLCEPSVRNRLLTRFIPIRLRPDANNRVLSRVKVTAFPTTLVAHPRGKVLAHRVGYQPVDQFHDLLSVVTSSEMPTTNLNEQAPQGAIR